MSNPTQTTIAQLLYLAAPPLNFARLVAELDCTLDRLPGQSRTLTWDCEDVAIFEAENLRLVLAMTDAPATDYAACLTITAGPANAAAPQTPLLRRADVLCHLIAQKLANTTKPDATLWHRTPQVATAELVDTFAWSLADADLIAWALPTPHVDTRHSITPVIMVPLTALSRAIRPFGRMLSLLRSDSRRLTPRTMAIAGSLLAVGGQQLIMLM